MKVFLLVTCCILSLIIDISDSRTPPPRPFPNPECAGGKVYATCYMRQKGDDDSREDSRGDDNDDENGGDDGSRGDNGGDDGRDDGRDDNRGSRNASRRGRDDDGNGNGDDTDGGIRGSVFFSQKVDENCRPTSELKVRVRIRGLGGDDDDNNRRAMTMAVKTVMMMVVDVVDSTAFMCINLVT